jgi:hypothetical protein
MVRTNLGMAPRKGLATAAAKRSPPACGPAGGMYHHMMEINKIKKERKDKLVEIRASARKLRKEADSLDYVLLQLVDQAKAKRAKCKELIAEAEALQILANADESEDESDGE